MGYYWVVKKYIYTTKNDKTEARIFKNFFIDPFLYISIANH